MQPRTPVGGGRFPSGHREAAHPDRNARRARRAAEREEVANGARRLAEAAGQCLAGPHPPPEQRDGSVARRAGERPVRDRRRAGRGADFLGARHAPVAAAMKAHTRKSRSGRPRPYRRPMRVLALAPHPDDEILGAGAVHIALARAGHEVNVYPVTLGRSHDHERRHDEMVRACRVAGLQLIDVEPLADERRRARRPARGGRPARARTAGAPRGHRPRHRPVAARRPPGPRGGRGRPRRSDRGGRREPPACGCGASGARCRARRCGSRSTRSCSTTSSPPSTSIAARSRAATSPGSSAAARRRRRCSAPSCSTASA